MLPLSQYESIALSVVNELAKMGLQFYHTPLTHQVKGDGSWVSHADVELEHKARALLKKHTPELGFLGEELGSLKFLKDDTGVEKQNHTSTVHESLLSFEHGINEPVGPLLNRMSDTYWMLDPIDGTISFLSKSPLWSTMLALVVKGEPVVGIVALPALNEVFVATKGQGARFGFLNDFQNSAKPCFTRATTSLNDARLSVSSPMYFSRRGIESWYTSLLSRNGEMRTHSDAYGYTRILCGGIDAQIDPMSMPHDGAALQVLFDETPGATFTTLQFEKGPQRFQGGSMVAACNQMLCDAIKADYHQHLIKNEVAKGLPQTSISQAFVLDHQQKPFAQNPNETRLWARAIEQAFAMFQSQHTAAFVEDISVIVSETKNLNIHIKNGSFDTPTKIRLTSGIAIRAIVDGATAMVNISWPEQDAAKTDLITQALTQANSQARLMNSPHGKRILSARDHVLTHVGEHAWGTTWDAVEFNETSKHMAKLHKNIIDKRIQTIESSMSAIVENRVQIFLNGSQHTVTNLSAQCSHRVTAVEGDEKRRAFNRVYVTKKPNRKEFVDDNGISLQRIQKQAIELLTAPFVPENISYDYLAIDADLLGLILHEAIGHASEGDLVITRQSGFGVDGKIQEMEVGPSWLNIVIDGSLANCGLSPIDAEGTLARRKTLVANGKLVDGIHTLETALTSGSVPDGSARFENVFHPWINRMSSIWVQSQELRPLLMDEKTSAADISAEEVHRTLSQSEFLKDGKTVLYLSGWKGGTASCSNLEFRADVARVYLMNPGKAPQLMREANFTGIATECFRNVVAAFGPVLCRSVGMCGKDGQSVPTSDGGPAIVVMKHNDSVHVIGAGEVEAS